MRTLIRCWCLLSLVLCAQWASAATVTIRSDSWFPMNGDPSSPTPGYMIEIIQVALQQAGHTLDYQLMPWERSLDTVRKGEFDCVVGAARGDAPDFVFPEESMGILDTGFYGLPGEQFTYSLDNVKLKKLASISGYTYDEGPLDEYILAGGPNVTVTKGDEALEKNIKMLLAKRVEIIVESPSVMYAQLAKMGLSDQVVELGVMGEVSDIYMACSPAKPSSKIYTDLISSHVKLLRQSGELMKILAKYGLKDWQ